MNSSKRKTAFTLVELVIVIAVVAILAAVLIPTFAGVIHSAKENAALENARSAWTEVMADDEILGSPDALMRKHGKVHGWFFDVMSGKFKYHEGKFTVTYDTVDFSVISYDGSIPCPEITIRDSGFGEVVSWYDGKEVTE